MSRGLSRRAFVAGTLVSTISFRVGLAAPATTQAGAERFPFYAMDTGLRGPDVPTLADKVALLRELGYWGIDYTYNGKELPHLLELLDTAGLQLACIYLSPAIEDGLNPRLQQSIRQMRGRPTRIELAIRSRTFKPSDPSGDNRALDLLRRCSDWAADTGPVVSIYPHTGLWTQRVQDGVRLAAAAGRKNIGTNFNLVHWSWVKQDEPLETVLKIAMPYLLAVSINGLAGRKIVPLGEGDYDVTQFMKNIAQAGYRGPVGFQGYGIPGPSRALLQQSMNAWRETRKRLEPDTE